jgi:putative holliday junction resolvase
MHRARAALNAAAWMAPMTPKRDFHDLMGFAAALPVPGVIMSIDVGTKTLGLALSDRTRLLASGLETLWRKKLSKDLEILLPLAVKHEVAAYVIGHPINMDGTKGPRAQASAAFARSLAAVVELPILLWDERLSTVAAERALLEADTSRAKRAEKIDMVAAVIILQGLLERLREMRPKHDD